MGRDDLSARKGKWVVVGEFVSGTGIDGDGWVNWEKWVVLERWGVETVGGYPWVNVFLVLRRMIVFRSHFSTEWEKLEKWKGKGW